LQLRFFFCLSVRSRYAGGNKSLFFNRAFTERFSPIQLEFECFDVCFGMLIRSASSKQGEYNAISLFKFLFTFMDVKPSK